MLSKKKFFGKIFSEKIFFGNFFWDNFMEIFFGIDFLPHLGKISNPEEVLDFKIQIFFWISNPDFFFEKNFLP